MRDLKTAAPASPLKLADWPDTFESYRTRCDELGIDPLVDAEGFTAAVAEAREQLAALEEWRGSGRTEKLNALYDRIAARPEELLYARIGVYAHLNRIALSLPTIPDTTG